METTLKNFGCSLSPTEMGPACLVMIEGNNTPHLMIRNKPPKNLVRTALKQVSALPNKEFH